MSAKSRNVIHSTGPGAFVMQAGRDVRVQFTAKRKPKMEYPAGSIGADLTLRNYIRYLTERYFRFREADASFGPKAVRRFSYAVLFKNIESHFKAPTYFIPTARFDDLVDFLQDRIEATILGKRNRAKGHRNYVTFDEFQLEAQALVNLPAARNDVVQEKQGSYGGKSSAKRRTSKTTSAAKRRGAKTAANSWT